MPAGVSDRTRDTHSGKKRVQEGQRKVWREKATAFCPWHRVSLFPTHKREPKPVPVPRACRQQVAPSPSQGDASEEGAPAARGAHSPLAQSSFLHTTAVRREFQFSFHQQIKASVFLPVLKKMKERKRKLGNS